MLPKLNSTQNVFIEITNPVHGGKGWELGICIWSPMFDKKGSKAWKIMEEIKQGDIIIHLVDINGKYHWNGISITNSDIIQNLEAPPKAEIWRSNWPYQRLNLTFYNKVKISKPISDFFSRYKDRLKEIHNKSDFYVIYGSQKELRVSQRYIAKCREELYYLFDDFSNVIDFNPIFKDLSYYPTENEPQNPDYNAPGRIKTVVSRIVRDTSLSRNIKVENDWICQICGCSILLPNNNYYIEGHHLKPLGGEHAGPDIKGNIIILCPTHHAEFDYGSMAINPENGLVEHIDINSIYHNKQTAYFREDLDKEYLHYHYTEIFKK